MFVIYGIEDITRTRQAVKIVVVAYDKYANNAVPLLDWELTDTFYKE